VSVNKATKALLYSNFSYKTYVAELKLGTKTSSGDLTSDIIEEKDVPVLTKEKVDEILQSFVGESTQMVPMTSAVHVNGMKLYKYAQQGLEVERPSRQINIKYIRLLDLSKDTIKFQCLVSSGTYIRVLGEDIAEKLGTVGHLISLDRIAFGEKESITINQAIDLEEASDDKIQPIIDFIDLPHYHIDEDTYKRVVSGQTIPLNVQEDKLLLVYNDIGIAIYARKKNQYFKCERGLW
jgi:tRNA pseudouridine55 synthase